MSRGSRLAIDVGEPGVVSVHGERSRLRPREWALLAVYVEAARRGQRGIEWEDEGTAWQRLGELWAIARVAAPPRQRGGVPSSEFAANTIEKAHTYLRAALARLSPALARAMPRARQNLDKKGVYADPTALLPHLAPRRGKSARPRKLPDRALGAAATHDRKRKR